MAKIVGGSLGVVGVGPVEEFFNENHSKKNGQFISASDWYDVTFKGKKYTAKQVEGMVRSTGKDILSPEDRKAQRIAKLKKAALIAAGVAVAAGVVFLGVKLKQSGQSLREEEDRAKQWEIPGSKLHFTRRWSETDKYGRKIHVIDSTGKTTDDEAKGILRHLVDQSNRDPLPGRPPKVVIRDRNDPDVKSAFGYVMGRPGARTINISHKMSISKGPEGRLYRFLEGVNPRWKSPVMTSKEGRHGGDKVKYTVSHEYGHLKDFDGEREEMEKIRPGSSSHRRGYTLSHLFAGQRKKREDAFRRVSSPTSGLSKYGRTNPYEGYAESYAEWYLTGGKTTNPAANHYARQFGWKEAS